MDVTSQYMKACTDTWLQCEHLLIALHQQPVSFSEQTTKVVDECARICLGMMHALKHKWVSMPEVAILCVGICEECAEVCERYEDQAFVTCAASCRECSNIFSQLIAPTV